jgi:Domain of unknown function (DUF5666)
MKLRYLAIISLLAALTVAYAQDGPPPGAFGTGMGGGGMGGARGTGGIVTAINGSTITIKTEEGDIYQVLTSANSRIMKQREPVKITEIHVGDAVLAGGQVDVNAKTVGAIFVAVLTPEQAATAKKRREEYGKTWTAGEVTAIKDTNIIIKGMGGTTQTISVDENTSFKKHADSITLSDIAVGDRLQATGALKGGSFAATTVTVGRQGGPGDGRGPRGEQPGAPPNGQAPATIPPGAPQ